MQNGCENYHELLFEKSIPTAMKGSKVMHSMLSFCAVISFSGGKLKSPELQNGVSVKFKTEWETYNGNDQIAHAL